MRASPLPNLRSTVSLWALRLDSEDLQIVQVPGRDVPANPPR